MCKIFVRKLANLYILEGEKRRSDLGVALDCSRGSEPSMADSDTR